MEEGGGDGGGGGSSGIWVQGCCVELGLELREGFGLGLALGSMFVRLGGY